MWRNFRPVYEVYAVELPAPVPHLELVPRTVTGQRGGGRAVLVGDDGFDGAFEIRSTRHFARELLVPEVRAALFADTNRRYRFEQGTLRAWTVGRLNGRTVALNLGRLVNIVEAVPRTVWQRYAGSS